MKSRNSKTIQIYVVPYRACDTTLSMANTFSCLEQQLEHYRTRTFQEEYLAFLKKHGAHLDEKYLWDSVLSKITVG